MSDAHGLTKENLMFTFPVGLRENPSIVALGDVTMETLAKRPTEISLLTLYPRIDELPENLLDILAYDFKVDWWDPNYTIEEKRRTLKDSWRVHKMLGTKAAVETAISAIYPKTKVQEWFEYGGKPYHFRIQLDVTGETWSDERPRRVLERVGFYKSLRSHLEEIRYTVRMGTRLLHAGGAAFQSIRLPMPELADYFDFRDAVHTGSAASKAVRLPMPELADHFNLLDAVQAGGELGARVRLSVPER